MRGMRVTKSTKEQSLKECINQLKDFTLQSRSNMVRYNYSIAERALNVMELK